MGRRRGSRRRRRRDSSEGVREMLPAKETAASPLWCVRQPGYISRVNDSGISISVSVRWLSLPTLPG